MVMGGLGAVMTLVLIGVVLLLSGLKILREYERAVIFRLGRLVSSRGPGVIYRNLGNRTTSYLFETNRHLPYSPRRIQQIVKATAEKAKIKKRVYPHLLRHSVATTLLERGMPIEQIQKFLGHAKLEITQVYAESTPEMLKDSYRRALAE